MRTSFDIETVPKPQEELDALIPEFDPESVKFGNTKDETKRAAMIDEARVKHRQNFIRDAALNPVTSTCKMVGFLRTECATVFIAELDFDTGKALQAHGEKIGARVKTFQTERIMLLNAMAFLKQSVEDSSDVLAGYFSNNWDLPYLFRRAWLNGICESVRKLRRGRYFKDNIVDLYDEWGMGERFPATGGLDGLCKMLKTPRQKNGDGATFGELYARDPIAALEYNINDLFAIDGCAERMGVV